MNGPLVGRMPDHYRHVRARLVLVLALGGCSLFATSRHPDRAAGTPGDPCDPAIVPALDAIGAAVAFGLVAYGALAADSPLTSDRNMRTGPLVLSGGLVAGVTFGVSAIIGATRIRSCRAFVTRRDEAQTLEHATAARARREHLEKVRAEAWALTKLAAAAARRGDCVTVDHLAPQIRALDIELHDRVLLHDAAIRRCFGDRYTPESRRPVGP